MKGLVIRYFPDGGIMGLDSYNRLEFLFSVSTKLSTSVGIFFFNHCTFQVFNGAR